MERRLSKKDATVLALCGMLDEPLTESKKQEWFGDDIKQTNNWCGIEGIKHIWNGSWSDPQIEYNGKIYNEWDVQDYVGEVFNNELTEQGQEIPQGDAWISAFSSWCKENEDWVKSMIEELEPDEVVKENKEIKTESEKWDSDGLNINGWHLEEETTNGGITRYWLYNPKGLGGSLIIYPDTIEELDEYISKNQQIIGFEGNYLPKTIYNKIISLVRNGIIKLRGKQEEGKQLQEERYYYGEVEDVKNGLKNINSNVEDLINHIKKIQTQKDENEYSEKQMKSLNEVISSLSMYQGLSKTLLKLLDEQFEDRIVSMPKEVSDYIDVHRDELESKTESKKLTENEMTDLKDSLPDNREPNADTIDKDVNGVLDGILVIVDPEINTEDYQEVIDRAQEIIEDTEEGKIPFIEDYLNQYIQTCPICGKTFVSKQLLQSGDTCPLCLEQPEQFLTVGKIEPDEEQAKELEQAGNEDLSNDIDIEQDNTEPDENAIEEFSIEDEEE